MDFIDLIGGNDNDELDYVTRRSTEQDPNILQIQFDSYLNDLYKSVTQFLIDFDTQTAPTANVVVAGKIITTIKITYIKCLDQYNMLLRNTKDKIPDLIMPEGIEADLALKFIEFISDLYAMKKGNTKNINSVDFMYIIHLLDYFQLNTIIASKIASLIEKYHYHRDNGKIEKLLANFIDFYELHQYGPATSHLIKFLTEKITFIEHHSTKSIKYLQLFDDSFFNTARGRHIMIQKLKEIQMMPYEYWEFIIDQIIDLHSNSKPISLKGIYEFLTVFDWFNVNMNIAYEKFKKIHELYPDFRIPNNIKGIYKYKRALISNYKTVKNTFNYKQGMDVGKTTYIHTLNGHEKFSMYTTTFEASHCQFKIEIKNTNIRLVNKTQINNRILHICFSISNITTDDDHIVAEKQIIKNRWHWDFSSKHPFIFFHVDDDFSYQRSYQIIFHQIYFKT